MILMTILLVILAVFMGISAAALMIVGAGFTLIFGDMIIFIVAVVCIIKLIKKLRKK